MVDEVVTTAHLFEPVDEDAFRMEGAHPIPALKCTAPLGPTSSGLGECKGPTTTQFELGEKRGADPCASCTDSHNLCLGINDEGLVNAQGYLDALKKMRPRYAEIMARRRLLELSGAEPSRP